MGIQNQIIKDFEINYFQNRNRKGTPLLLIHGFSSGWEDWLGIIEILGKTKSIVAIDLPGHGNSDRLKEYTISNYSQPLLDLIKQIFPKSFDLIGHSLGSLISIYLANKLNSKVRKLVIEDPPIFLNRNNQPPIIDLLENEATEKQNWKTIIDSENYMRTIHSDLSETKIKIRAKHSFLTDIKAYNFSNFSETISLTGILKNLNSETLLINGDPEFGGILSNEKANQIAKLIPTCSVLSWQNTGHVIHNEHPEQYCKTLKEFLD